jgi:hypothetical protein
MEERIDSPGSPVSPPSVPDYADVGDRVASILNAAEEAARQIRADAERAAETTRREAEREAERYADEHRRQADGEVERLVAGAAADAEAIRDTAHAAAQRIAEEGHHRLEELRGEARALERRFESAVDELRDLIMQLEELVLTSVRRPADEVQEPEDVSPPIEDADLSGALWPAPEREAASGETEDSELDTPMRSHHGERPPP